MPTTFFPNASTYVLSGLERTGPIPDCQKMRGHALSAALGHLKVSLRQVLSHSYFITSQMGAHLSRGQLPGTHSGAVRVSRPHRQDHPDVSYVQLEPDGTVKPLDASAPPGTMPRAVKIIFSSAGGADLSRRSITSAPTSPTTASPRAASSSSASSSGPATASSRARPISCTAAPSRACASSCSTTACTILQDDTGVPVQPVQGGRVGACSRSAGIRRRSRCLRASQPRLRALFEKNKPAALDFGIGYRWRTGQSNLVLATRKPRQAAVSP